MSIPAGDEIMQRLQERPFSWTILGLIEAKHGAPSILPRVPEHAGLYKLAFALWGKNYAYIGETGRLRARIREYTRTPTRGNHGEHLMFDLLTEAGRSEISVCCVGLEPRRARLDAEAEAIAEARRQGLTCLNRGKDIDSTMQRFRLESEKKMLEEDLARVRDKLAQLVSE